MARMTLEEVAATLTTRKAEGVIWNPEFVALKDRLGRILDAADDQIRDDLQAIGVERFRAYELTSNFICTNYTNLAGRVAKLEKALKEEGVLPRATEALAKLKNLMAVCELVKELKPMVKKGRQPNPEAEARKERDLENTGTCGCCGRNIKLTNDTRIWGHGFEITGRGYGYGTGYKTGVDCFGTDYQPIEISPKVWQDMLTSWQAYNTKLPSLIEQAEAEFAAMPKPGPELTKEAREYAKVYAGRRMAIYGLKQDLAHFKTAIPEMVESIANWSAKPLPGTRR